MNSFEEGFLLEFGVTDHGLVVDRTYWVGGTTNYVGGPGGYQFSYPSDYILDDSGFLKVFFQFNIQKVLPSSLNMFVLF